MEVVLMRNLSTYFKDGEFVFPFLDYSIVDLGGLL